MIQYLEGDLFKSPAEVLVNPVNTMGVMGKGLALEFKKRYPSMFESYKHACESHLFTIGKLMLFRNEDYGVLLFPTKQSWRQPSKLEYIEAGLRKFLNTYERKGISSIAFPKLGCGNGELSWEDVRPLMTKYLSQVSIPVYIYVGEMPQRLPEHKIQGKMWKWLRNHAKDMSFNGVIDDVQFQLNASLMDYDLTIDGKAYQLSWVEEGLAIQQDKAKKMISPDTLFDYWDQIRKQRIVTTANQPIEFVIWCELLKRLGYLDAVYIIKNDRMQQGYQLYSGAGRAFAYKESV